MDRDLLQTQDYKRRLDYVDDHCCTGSTLAVGRVWRKNDSELPENRWMDSYADRDRIDPNCFAFTRGSLTQVQFIVEINI
jgi:hypothetical protein